ncbi:MAG: sulfite exporter TauE/SafE family protein [Pseudomonadota bacterium]
MIDWVLTTTNLTGNEFIALTIIVTLAGVIRGFSGFALSGLVMATAIFILPPIALIPMLWWLEMAASLLLVKGGWQDADRKTTFGLVGASIIGWPLGLTAMTALAEDTSKIVALAIVVALAVSQLIKVKLPFLATKPGLYTAGLTAGIVSGLSSVGPMVIALFFLAKETPARMMRGSIVLFLFLSSILSFFIQLAFGVMDFSGVARGLVFAAPTALGVAIGLQMFTVRFEPYYRPVCLGLLISLACFGLVRQVVAL